MTKREILETLEWRSFSTYPPQNCHITVRCYSVANILYVTVRDFNAVTFKPQKLIKGDVKSWNFKWLPMEMVGAALKHIL